MTRISSAALICMLAAAAIAPALPVSVSVSQSPASAAISTDGGSGLVAHWPFDDPSGGVAVDVAGGLNGTVHGASRADGPVDGCLWFDGEDDYVDFPPAVVDAIGSLGQGTIAFWFNYSYLLDRQEIEPLFHLGIDDGGEPDNMFIIELGHKYPVIRRLYVTWVIGKQIPVLCYDTGFHVDEDEWYHFAVTVGPDGNTGYLNGVELVNRYYNFGAPDDALFLDDIPVQDQFTIGYGKTNDVKSPGFLYYRGYVDDVRVYNQSLSAGEISELYAMGGAPLNIEITRPQNGSFLLFDHKIWAINHLVAGGPVTVEVGHVAAGGRPVEQVAFYVDDVRRFTDDEAPYRWTWSQVAWGKHVITAVATDAAGHQDRDTVTVWKLF